MATATQADLFFAGQFRCWHETEVSACPLTGDERTWLRRGPRSETDPDRSFDFKGRMELLSTGVSTQSNLIVVVSGSPKLYTLCVRHPIDVAIMFAALWLLGSMVLDHLTPKELTVYMIAAATAPAVIGTALSYYLRFPAIDFVSISATLWLIAALTIEWISPVPLPGFMIGAALAPALVVGAILHWHRYRSRRRSG
ncbi:MAG: hypothetical protein QOE55_2558 [Acidobacteriaceae bacterium]|jgi:hypothetical protein|nr:hypothetical protein [Acidobacteriaceae bacterium]